MENPSSGSSRFLGDSRLSSAVDTTEGWGIQGGGKLERAQENPTKFNKSKCQVLHPGQGNPSHEHRLGAELLESSPGDKDFGAGG